MIQQLGIFGYPLTHSISPVFQQAALDYYSLPVRYSAWETPPERLSEEVGKLRREEFLGANVTIPHKEQVKSLLDSLDPWATTLGAVNTIVKKGQDLVGYNTDAHGLVRSLKRIGFDPSGKVVLLLGAGGAARAAAFGLAGEGISHLIIANRTLARALALADNLQGTISSVEAVSLVPSQRGIDACHSERSEESGGVGAKGTETGRESQTPPQILRRGVYPKRSRRAPQNDDQYQLEMLPPGDSVLEGDSARVDLIVNATSIGTRHGDAEGQTPLRVEQIPPGALVYDMVYNPLVTPLMQEARKTGARAFGGLSMLIYQGAASFELWTGKRAPIEVMFEAARKAMAHSVSLE